MPELPDLQVFSANLDKALAGRKLQGLKVGKRARVNVPVARLKKALEQRRLKEVYREGKELRFAFRGGEVLGMHLMLRGRLQWLEAEDPPKAILLELQFAGREPLVLTDFQYSARIILNPPAAEAPDALSKEVTLGFWKEQLQTKAGIKKLLLDQSVVRGIGNAYADEILWEAGISPFSISSAIPANKIKDLARAVKQVLKKGERQIRKAAPGIIGGELRDFMVIHNARLRKSPTGAVIKHKPVGGRKTYYTDEQTLYK